MKYAFLIMGPYTAADDVWFPENENMTRMIGVKTAANVAARLKDEGYEAIELCGAFGEAGARKIIDATGHSVAVGFVTHFPEDDDLFKKTFG